MQTIELTLLDAAAEHLVELITRKRDICAQMDEATWAEMPDLDWERDDINRSIMYIIEEQLYEKAA